MTYIEGDIIVPSEIILPKNETPKAKTGQLFLSGAAVCYYNGTTHKLLADA